MKIIILFFAVALSAIASCNVVPRELSEDEQASLYLEDKDIAVEFLAEYTLVNYSRPLESGKDAGFIDDNIRHLMQTKRLYRNRRCSLSTKSGDAEPSDTLFYSEQIPFCAEIDESNIIFKNGSSEFSQKTDLNAEQNPLLNFHETDLDLKQHIAAIQIKDGQATTYNSAGEVLAEQSVEMPDYTEYIAELQKAQEESNTETKAGIRRDINWLRRRMALSNKTKAAGPSYYRIYESGQDTVVLEQDLFPTKSGEIITTRTFLSRDISRIYGFEKLEGGFLKFRCKNSFSSESNPNLSSNLPAIGMSEYNPSGTITEEISFLSDGTPMIRVSEKEYRQNITRFNLQ